MSGIIASLLDVGHRVAYAEGNPGWFADLRDANGRRIAVGFGATQEQAYEHLAERIGRAERDGGHRGGPRESRTDAPTGCSCHHAQLKAAVVEHDQLIEQLRREVRELREVQDRSELGNMIGDLLDQNYLITIGRDDDNGGYFAELITAAGRERTGDGDTPAAALRDAMDALDATDEVELDLTPYCATCGSSIGVFLGYGSAYRHYEGEGTVERPVRLLDPGHEPVVAWREAGDQ